MAELLDACQKGTKYKMLLDLLRNRRALEQDIEKVTRRKVRSGGGAAAKRSTDLMLLSGKLMQVNHQIEKMVMQS
jgi:hypothetical protein